jgi:hypothetical protein
VKRPELSPLSGATRRYCGDVAVAMARAIADDGWICAVIVEGETRTRFLVRDPKHTPIAVDSVQATDAAAAAAISFALDDDRIDDDAIGWTDGGPQVASSWSERWRLASNGR